MSSLSRKIITKKNLPENPPTFKVKMILVQEKELPKIDDEFAKSLGKFENLEALKTNLGKEWKWNRKKRMKKNGARK